MIRSMRKMLRAASVSPDPVKKDRFVRAYRVNSPGKALSGWRMIRSQIGYIRPWVWCVSLLALVLAASGLANDREAIFAAAVMMPFVSGVAMLESFRSRRHGMLEMAGATLCSVKGMLFARIACVGTAHLLLLLLVTLLIGSRSDCGLCMTGVLITIPYLLTSVGCMALERTNFGRRNAFACMGVAALTAGLVIAARELPDGFAASHRALWYLMALVLAAKECREIKNLFHWEEYAWN